MNGNKMRIYNLNKDTQIEYRSDFSIDSITGTPASENNKIFTKLINEEKALLSALSAIKLKPETGRPGGLYESSLRRKSETFLVN